MKRGFIPVYVILLFFSLAAHAQKKDGDEDFANYRYPAAIKCYLKAISSDPNDTASLIQLANCYSILRDYDNAEIYYARAASIPNIPPSVYFRYGEILKINGKLDLAIEQFERYSELVPSNKEAANEIKYCDDMKKKPELQYEIFPIEGINSSAAEFSPALYKNNIVFVSDRGEDLVNFDKSSNSGGNFLKMYTATQTDNKHFDKPSHFKVDNSAGKDVNEGPATFTSDGKMMLFTEVASIRKKGFVNQAKIYYCTYDGNNWSKPQPFPYNSDTYSVMDPSVSADGQWLYFASNMPGGYGGSDIYECQKSGDGWSKPANLGAEVNTPGNEVFPYIRKDGTLFFSSDKHFNYGGLDIFSAQKFDVTWTDVENLGPDINSNTDDFGICFNSDGRTGYFSSNRKDGSEGADDIFGFTYVGDYKPMKGYILASNNMNDPVPNVGVRLVNDSGRIIVIGKTDSTGRFIFTRLDPEKRYSVRIDEFDQRFSGKKKFYLADSTGKIVSVTIVDNQIGKFVFTQLPPEITRLPKMNVEDRRINLAGSILHGDSSKPVSNVKLELVNANGKVISSTTTNEFGGFVFTNLPADDNYTFRINAEDAKLPPNTRVVLNNSNGDMVKLFYAGADGTFKFQLLAADTLSIKRMKVEDAELRLSLKSRLVGENKQSLAGVNVNLLDKNGNVVESTKTDATGQFTFTNLPTNQGYVEEIDANDPQLKGMKKIYLVDNKGNVERTLDRTNNGFKFEVLPQDKVSMGSIYVYDPWLTALNLKNSGGDYLNNYWGSKHTGNRSGGHDSLYIIENIYYDYQKWDILPAAARVLDKVIRVMQNDPNMVIELDSYTDPRGSDDFNLQLSQKRADAAIDYIVTHGGIARTRLIGRGFGKTHLINHCGDPGVNCSEEELAKNRRTEFRITRK